jgi:protocatechuate 3,4-dioxygenase beta subunit
MFQHPRITLLFIIITLQSCMNQKTADNQTQHAVANATAFTRSIAEPCEDCELMFAGIPNRIAAIDTSDGWINEGQPLVIKGTIYKKDERTPASGIILYYYHTDKNGHYTPSNDTPQAARRHGYLRGWVQSDSSGHYAIYTNRPAQYPGERFEAHIHVVLKEPDMDKPYWIDPWIFEDDPLVTENMKSQLENRGGNGVLSPKLENGIQLATHDVILGLNIPGYPE